MRIDRTHAGWLVASCVILGAASVLYALGRPAALAEPMGGTPIGLAFGIAGFAFMIFAGLLGARKKVPVWRLGRAQTWMRGHLWLGLLSLPLILLHAGFHSGGPLTTALVWLLVIVVGSGLFGAALQHYMPATMTREVPLETIYEEIDHVSVQLRIEAAERIARVKVIAVPENPDEEGAAARGPQPDAPLVAFYEREIEPYLNHAPGRSALADRSQAERAFAAVRLLVPQQFHDAVDDLENICEEQRQLARQVKLHRWLHGWLLIHVPLSIALILLGAVHAIVALRY
ncbi:MAG: hypothetical protein WBE97_03225 [Candidatus Acidiferrales bacterium]